MKNKLFILLLLFALLSISAVSAADLDDNSTSVSVSDENMILSDSYADDLEIQQSENGQDLYSENDNRKYLEIETHYAYPLSEGDEYSVRIHVSDHVGVIPINMTINGESLTLTTNSDCDAYFYLGNLKAGDYACEWWVDTDKYYSDKISETLTITPRINTYLALSVDPSQDLEYGDTIALSAKITDESGGIVLTWSEDIYFYFNGVKKGAAETDGRGIATFTINDLSPGSYEVVAKYDPGAITKYHPSTSNTISFEVKKKSTSITYNRLLINMTADHTEYVGCYLEPSEAGSLSSYIADTSVANLFGVYHNEIEAIGPGETDLFVSFSGNDNYLPSSNNVTIHIIVNAFDVEIKLDNDTVELNEGDSFALNAHATYGLGIGYHSNDESIATVNDKGNITGVGEGTTTITLTAGGYGFYGKATRDVTVTVNKLIPTEIALDNVTVFLAVGQEIPSVAHLIVREDSDLLGAALHIFDLNYTVSNSSIVRVEDNLIKGIAEGDAHVTVSFNGFGNYAPALSKTFGVVVRKIPTDIVVLEKSFDLTVGDKILDGAVLLPLGAGPMNFVSSDEKVAVAENGTITALSPGRAVITVSFNGTDKYVAAKDKTITVNVRDPSSDIITVSDVTKYYGGPERFVVNVTDNQGNPVSNAHVDININGVDYIKFTNAKGSTSLALNLNSGEYTAVVKCNGNTVDADINVLTTVNGTDVVKMYKNATQYVATFLDSQGNYLKEGTAIKFNINGIMYERTVKENGTARLNLNLEQGDYIITAMNTETGEKTANNVTIIPTITENSDVTMFYRNGTQYTVKVLGDDGNPVGKGETVTFNINGMFYNRTTDDEGIAKLNLKLQPGDYVVTADYKGCRVSNSIHILPVLSAKNLTKKYGADDQFVATLVDGQGNPLAGEKVTFNINGVFYNRTTDASGQAKLNIKLQAGEYIITSSYNGANIANKVTVTA